jgi:hypothetical protein
MSPRLEVEGLSVASGTSANFTDWSQVQATVMPVVSLQEGYLECWGSAACIGNAGWFITAKQVVEQFAAKYGRRDDGTTGLFILWETDEPTGRGPNNYLGAPLPIVYIHPHGDADLVTLTASLPAQAPDLLRVAPLAFRMPQVGELLAAFGYSAMSLSGEVRRGERSSVDYERTFTVCVGEVLEQQPERRTSGVRGCPGVVTDAPIYSGMSGGPVFDMNGKIVGFASSSHGPIESAEGWNSYVALCAPALELAFMTRADDDDPLTEKTLAELVAADAVLSSADETFDVDTTTGKAMYRPSAQ